MGKKTTEKVKAFRGSYIECANRVKEYDKHRKTYASLLVQTKYGSKNLADGDPLPKDLVKSTQELKKLMKFFITPLAAQIEDMFNRMDKELVDLQQWVEKKSKSDPTTWRKIKDSIKVKR